MQAARDDGPGAAGVPDRQGAGANDACRRRARARAARSSSRIERRDEEHSRRLGRARARRSPRRRSRRRSSGRSRELEAQRAVATDDAGMCGAAARRGVLPLGAQGLDDDDDVAGRGPRDGPERAAAPARADGRDPEGDRLHAGHRRRADEGAGEGSALQVLRRRQGPRRDHGVHPGSPRRGSARRCRARSTRSSIRTWK